MAEAAAVTSSQQPDPICMNQIVKMKKYSGQISLVITNYLVWLDSQTDDVQLGSETLQIVTCEKEILRFKLILRFYKLADDHIGIFLKSHNDRNLKIILSISLLGSQKSRTSTHHYPKFESWGWKFFLSKTKLKKEATQFLPGGALTLECNFHFFGSESEISTSLALSTTSGSCLANNFKTMWKKEMLTDFKLVCNNKVFLCHKFVLASRSDVFETMFSHEDTTEALTGQAIIKDCTPQVLRNFLEFLYTDQLEDKKCFDSCELMLQADKYNVSSLKNVCEKHLAFNVKCNNAIERLQLAVMIRAPELLETTAKYIVNYCPQLLDSVKWKDMIKNNPEALDAIEKVSKPQEQATQPQCSPQPHCSTQPKCPSQLQCPNQPLLVYLKNIILEQLLFFQPEYLE